MIRPIYWKQEKICLIDQTRLPAEWVEIEIEKIEDLWEAIRRLQVRGAPAIGIAAAFGVALEARRGSFRDSAECLQAVESTCRYLATSRPTAVNLFWALNRMKECAQVNAQSSLPELRDRLLAEAESILEEDIRMGRQLGKHGATLLQDGDVVLTHCNAGGLATGGYGTALGIIYAAKEEGKRIHVYADETRPLLQGARLTTWELMQNQIEVTLICDNMAAAVLRDQTVRAVIVGADRIAANGDFANKIGTYGLAVLAHAHQVPFYTAAPYSSIDLTLKQGKEIPIEIRDSDEVRTLGSGNRIAPPEVAVYNPAFDMTPAHLVSAIITERGIARSPFEISLRGLDA